MASREGDGVRRGGVALPVLTVRVTALRLPAPHRGLLLRLCADVAADFELLEPIMAPWFLPVRRR